MKVSQKQKTTVLELTKFEPQFSHDHGNPLRLHPFALTLFLTHVFLFYASRPLIGPNIPLAIGLMRILENFCCTTCTLILNHWTTGILNNLIHNGWEWGC